MLRRLKSPYVAVTLIFTCLYTAMFMLMPMMFDDVWFRYYLQPFLHEPSWANLWEGLIENHRVCAVEDNVRIPNTIMPLLVIFTNRIPAVLNGACVGLSLWLGAEVTGVWRKSPLGFSLWIVGFTLLLPWADHMFGVAFATNYVPLTALTLTVCLLFLRDRTSPWLLLSISFLTGMWHEAGIATLLGCVTAVALFFRKYRNKQAAGIAAGCIAALSVYFLAPATAAKLGESAPTLRSFFTFSFNIIYGIWYFVYLLAMAFCLAFKSVRARLLNPATMLCAGGATAGWILFRLFPYTDHTAWPMLVFVALGAACIVKATVPANRISIAVAIIITTACTVQSALCLPWFARLRHEQEYAVALAGANPGKSGLFAPLTLPAEQPLYLFGHPNFNSLMKYGYPVTHVVPERLKDFSPEKAESIGLDGTEAYLYNGLIVLPNQPLEQVHWNCMVEYNGKDILPSYCIRSYFMNEAGTFVHVRPYQPLRKAAMSTVTGFRLDTDNLRIDPYECLYEIDYIRN